MKKFEGKVVLIVGSTSGIGKKIAEKFAAEGATPIITGRREEAGKQVVEEITARGLKADFIRMDVLNIEESERAIEAIAEKYGRIDSFIYNSGIVLQGNELDEAGWDRAMNTNLKAAYFLARKAYQYVQGTKGNIVFTSSISGLKPSLSANRDASVPYGVSKAALNYLTSILAVAYAKSGVRVNCVAPGVTKTDILANAHQDTLKALEKTIPLGFLAEAEDMAEIVSFLCSDECRYVTGQVIQATGGAHIA